MGEEDKKKVRRLDSVGEIYLISAFIVSQAGKVEGQERTCVTESGVYILFARPASFHFGFLAHWIKGARTCTRGAAESGVTGCRV